MIFIRVLFKYSEAGSLLHFELDGMRGQISIELSKAQGVKGSNEAIPRELMRGLVFFR